MAKAKYKLADVMSMTSLPDDYDELLSIYRTAAKAADQRLVRLEKLSQEKNFKTATKWAYARAQRDAATWSETGTATRFNIKPPSSAAQLQNKIQDIRTFLAKPSSTKTGIIEVYKKKAATLAERYGLEVDWRDMGDFFEGGEWEKITAEYDSKQTAKVIASIRKYVKSEDLKKAIEEHKGIEISLPDDPAIGGDKAVIERMVKRHVRKYGSEIYDLLYAGK